MAREITHEAFLRLWERRNTLLADSNEKAWLMRVAVNLAISHRRSLLARLWHRVPPPSVPDPSSVAITRLEGEKVRAALLTLHPRERAVLALRYGKDLSFAEVGSILDEPEATVRTRCHRAVLKLRTHLNEWIVDEAQTREQHPNLAVKL